MLDVVEPEHCYIRHGHCKDQDVQDGLERGIGNGRHQCWNVLETGGIYREVNRRRLTF